MGRLVIASNHLPRIQLESGDTLSSNGRRGLAGALRAPHRVRGGLWLGDLADVPELSEDDRAVLTRQLEAERMRPIFLAGDHRQRHREASEEVLWPLLHYQLDDVRLDADAEWRGYREVNQRFADEIAAVWREGDLVWIHDYPLALVPELLRRRLPHARIGFFLHAPFPAADVFRLLPWREEVLRGMLGADLIGFNTAVYRSNFARATSTVLTLDFDLDTLRWADRRVQLGVFPVGVDLDELSTADDGAGPIRKELDGSGPPHQIVLGIDRLDRSKGILRRLHAFSRLLDEDRGAATRVKLIQVVLPAGDSAEPGAELRTAVNELVGRINSRHGTPSSAPIHFLNRELSRSELLALYRTTDVMLVTPLRDGMNLVAKEYVAARTDGRGVLVLSEFAGAAEELREALVVNPYDIGAVMRSLRSALAMPEDEQRLRMASMRSQVMRQDVHAWHRAFVECLETVTPTKALRQIELGGASLDEQIANVRAAPQRILLLDYDGTLVPFAALPDLAVPDPELLRLLASLAHTPGTFVHIVTGRAASSIERMLGELPVGLHAEHGYWSRSSPAERWTVRGSGSLTWKAAVAPIMSSIAARTPGALVETKTAAIAFHYRRVDPTLAAIRLSELRGRLEGMALPYVELLEGSKVLEVRLSGVHKGLPSVDLLSAVSDDTAVLAIGDDRTDEDMFAAVQDRGVTVSVGPRPSRARHRVASPAEVRALLSRLVGPGEAASA